MRRAKVLFRKTVHLEEMIPTKTHGICGECRESNPYTEIHCRHCGARLPWAFLIDGKSDEDFEAPIEKSIEHFFHLDRSTHFNIRCRFCNEPISEDEKICPHCGRWLVAPNSMTQGGAWPAWSVNQLVDPEAPEIIKLTEIYWTKKAQEK